MNKVVLMGRLTADPQELQNAARYTLAVDRRYVKRDDPNAQTADFISVVAFGKAAEFAVKWLKKGTKVCIDGRIQTGSYTNKDGVRVYTTDVVAENQEFAESKNANGSQTTTTTQAQAQAAPRTQTQAPAGSFNIPEDKDEELPWN